MGVSRRHVVSGVFPQALSGTVLPRDIVNGAWQEVEVSAVASYTITVPQYGTHFAVECNLRGDTAATSTALAVKINGDTTTGDYHWQRLGATNAAASVIEGTTFDVGTIAAATAVADYFSPLSLLFPEFMSARQKTCIVTGTVELAALNQFIYLAAHKRQTAGVGALVDTIQTVQLVPAAGNMTGTIRWAVVRR